MIYVPKAALVLSAGSGTFQRLIRWGERKWGEKPSRVNHSMLVVEGGFWPPLLHPDRGDGTYQEGMKMVWNSPIIIESGATVKTAPLYLHRADKFVIYDIEMTEEERALVAGEAGHHQGRPYAVLQLVGQLLDNKLFFGLNVFRRLAKFDPLDICSHLTGDSFESKISVTFGEPGYAQSPDDQDDFLRGRPSLVDAKGRVRKVTQLWDDIGDRG